MMQRQQQRLKWKKQENRGDPVAAFGIHLIPIERIVHVNWPGGNVVWQRPVALEIQQGTCKERLPIVNMTRRIIASLALSGVLLIVIVALGERIYISRQRRKNHARCSH